MESDISYIAEKKDNRAVVTNWFEKFDLSDTTEVIIEEDGYSTRDTIDALFGLGGLALPKELALVLNRELNQIKKVHKGVNK